MLKVLFAIVLSVQQIVVPVMVFARETAPQREDINFQLESQSSMGKTLTPKNKESFSGGEVAMPDAKTSGAPIESVQLVGNQASSPEDDDSASPLDAKVSIRVNNAPLTAFLDSISAQAKINFIISEGLESKKVTAYLRKVSVREALEILLQIKGLTYQRIGRTSTYVITHRSPSAPNLVTKLYVLNYIALASSGGGNISDIVSADVTSRAPVTPGMSGFPSSSDITGSGSAPAAASSGPSGSGILSIISSVLSKNGKIATDPRTNTLIITDIIEVFPQVEQILSELDKKAPQVLIETQIVEIDSTRINELGLDWGGTNGEMATFAGPSRQTDYLLRPGFFSGNSWKHFFSADGEITQGSLSLQQLTVVLRALTTRSEAKYLGKPKVVTLNNQTAVITISKDAAVATTAATTGGGSGTTSTGVERKRVGLTLQVTPQVNKEGYITLSVQPSYSDLTTSAITINSVAVLDPISRGTSTIVRVKNGQTVVLGGLLSSNESKVVRKVPFFGYIPIIGWFFSSISYKKSNTDLVIFLTPTILVD